MKKNSMFYLSILLIINTLLIPNVDKKGKDPIAIFGFTQHVNDDGTPSRDDRRYISKSLYLYEKNQYIMSSQLGRLEIIYYESEWGSWKIEGDKLILNGEKREIKAFGSEKVSEKYSGLSNFTKNNNSLEARDGRIWRHQQGMGARELFKKY
jgi:hypothetical protein